jgi:hypothetical protein
MTIDTSGLSEEQKATAEFKSMYAGMMHQLNDPGYITALCAHEAAHLIFYEMMSTIRYVLVPPKIMYDAQIGMFIGHLAAIELAEEPICEPHRLQEYVTMISHAQVAGRVVARKLLPDCYGGDKGDKEKFERICAELSTHFWGFPIDAEAVWTRAQNEVERRLEKESWIMESIQQRAIELRPLFGL